MANMKNKDINFYTQFGDPSKRKNKIQLVVLSGTGAILIAAACSFTLLFTKDMTLQTKIDELTAQTHDKTLLDKIKSADEMDADSAKMEEKVNVYLDNNKHIAYQNRIKDMVTDNLLMRIIECENSQVEVQSFSYSDQLVTLSITSKNENEAASYVMRLRETGVFEWVEYNGFAGSEGEYNYNITALFETEEEETGDGTNG